jgi:signal transduction histidine kinase
VSSLKIPLYSSLIARSLFVLFCVMILVLGSVGYLNVTRYKKEALQGMRQESAYVSRITAKAIELAMWNIDRIQVQQQMDALKSSVSFCGARVKDAQGNIFVDIDFPAKLSADKFADIENIYFINPNKTPEAREVIGTIEICSSKTTFNERLWSTIYQQIMFMIVAIVGALIGSYAAMVILIRPLNSIRYAMRDLSRIMTPITDRSLLKKNELGVLTETFNTMVKEIANSHQQLSYAKDSAEKAVIAKSEFLSNMSHELRTPMHAILNYANMGMKRLGKEEPEKLEKYFNNIQTAGNRLLGLLNNLLDLSKMESGKMKFTIAHENFKDVLDYVQMELDSLLKAKQLEVVLDIATADTNAMFDKPRVIQVLVNIFSNAIRYSPENGIIQATFYDACLPDGGNALCCSISNDGDTIPRDELETIFDKFVQSSKTKTGAGGTGLGLAISREIIEAHGGIIWAENLEEKGVVFRFLLPKQHVENSQQENS